MTPLLSKRLSNTSKNAGRQGRKGIQTQHSQLPRRDRNRWGSNYNLLMGDTSFYNQCKKIRENKNKQENYGPISDFQNKTKHHPWSLHFFFSSSLFFNPQLFEAESCHSPWSWFSQRSYTLEKGLFLPTVAKWCSQPNVWFGRFLSNYYRVFTLLYKVPLCDHCYQLALYK